MLVNEVLESYKKRTTHARPVKNFNDTITVRFAIQLTQIMGLDEQDQILTLNFWDQL
ncbi:neuronal acetylcholine receptor subunit alpha-5, partial [Elysia marginata]